MELTFSFFCMKFALDMQLDALFHVHLEYCKLFSRCKKTPELRFSCSNGARKSKVNKSLVAFY